MEGFSQGNTPRKWQNSDSKPGLFNKIKFLHILYVLILSSLISRQARTASCPSLCSPYLILLPPGLARCLPIRYSVCMDQVRPSAWISLVFPIRSPPYLNPWLPSPTPSISGFKSHLSHFPAMWPWAR